MKNQRLWPVSFAVVLFCGVVRSGVIVPRQAPPEDLEDGPEMEDKGTLERRRGPSFGDPSLIGGKPFSGSRGGANKPGVNDFDGIEFDYDFREPWDAEDEDSSFGIPVPSGPRKDKVPENEDNDKKDRKPFDSDEKGDKDDDDEEEKPVDEHENNNPKKEYDFPSEHGDDKHDEEERKENDIDDDEEPDEEENKGSDKDTKDYHDEEDSGHEDEEEKTTDTDTDDESDEDQDKKTDDDEDGDEAHAEERKDTEYHVDEVETGIEASEDESDVESTTEKNVFDNPFFNITKIHKYFDHLEKAIERLFRETSEEAAMLNSSVAETTEKDVIVDGNVYHVRDSVIKAGDKNHSVVIEAISSDYEPVKAPNKEEN